MHVSIFVLTISQNVQLNRLVSIPCTHITKKLSNSCPSKESMIVVLKQYSCIFCEIVSTKILRWSVS